MKDSRNKESGFSHKTDVRTSNLSDGQMANEVLILKPSSLVMKQERDFSMLAGHLLDLSPLCHQNSPLYAAINDYFMTIQLSKRLFL